MTWIMKRTSDGRGGFINTTAEDPVTGIDWGDEIGLDVAATYAGIFKGKEGTQDLNLVPRKFILEKLRKEFPDIWRGRSGLLIIPQALKDILDDLDPGKHIIWSVEIFTKRGVRQDGPFYGFVPGVHAAAIDEALSEVHVKEAKWFPQMGTLAAHTSTRTAQLTSKWNATVRKEALPDAHFWWDHGLTDNLYLLSDPLHAAVTEAGLKMISMKKLKDVAGTAAPKGKP